MRALLLTFSWQELRHHPWRTAAAVVAVMLGVALAFSVQLINTSALEEFSSAVRAVNGQPDLELRATQGHFGDAVFAQVAPRPEVTLASPVLELQTFALLNGQRIALRVLGVDALVLPTIAPALMPAVAAGADRLELVAPGQIFLNAAAQTALGADERSVRLEVNSPGAGPQPRQLRIGGSVAAGGAPLAVMDIGAAQDLFGRIGELTRIDLRLAPGTDRAAFVRALEHLPGWPSDVQAAQPGDATERISNLSSAYRVNLTVLALVALFTGAFLVFSILALSVAKRAQQFALLGVLGLTPRERLRLVLVESAVIGGVGSALGIALGTALAVLALRLLGGDLGGGYFDAAGAATPTLHWSSTAAAIYGILGVLAALVGGWWPARAAQNLPEAQTLKGLGAPPAADASPLIAIVLIATSVLLAGVPAIFGIPFAAYVSIGLLLVGGIAALPWLIALLYDRLAPRLAHHLLPMLAVERARRMRGTAAVAVSGVVAALSLAVALTVMVASFRSSVTQWLDVVLPADLYLRSAAAGAARGSGNEAAAFSPEFVQAVARLPGVIRSSTLRTRQLLLDPTRPPVTLIARSFERSAGLLRSQPPPDPTHAGRGDHAAGPARTLPLVGAALPVPPGQIGIYVSEPMVDLYGARPGTVFVPLSRVFGLLTPDNSTQAALFFVAGVWRDYARQFGAIAIDAADFERLTGDRRVSDVGLWLAPGASESALQEAIRALAAGSSNAPPDASMDAVASDIEFSSVTRIRANTLRIFDRSFAVTYWLQAVAIAIGLFGVAASFSAQVLARRKEFGLMAHLGFTRRQVLAVVAGEGAAWNAIGAAAGLALGLAVSLVLVHVVNPQSFHWTMDLQVPWGRLLALCAAVVAAGTITAWLAGRAAAGHDAILAVKEDW